MKTGAAILLVGLSVGYCVGALYGYSVCRGMNVITEVS